MITPQQSKAARALLGWDQAKLARNSLVSVSTIRDFERGSRTPMINNHLAMEMALTAAGIGFIGLTGVDLQSTRTHCEQCGASFLSGGARNGDRKRAGARFCCDQCRWDHNNEKRKA